MTELAANPVMLTEARQALHAIRVVATAPAGPEGVKRVVGRRLPTFPQTQMNDAMWAAWWQDWFDVCGDVPEVALEAGMVEWLRDPQSQFMPKPGKLRELALNTPNRAARAYERITDATRRAEPVMELPAPGPRREPEPRPTKAEIEGMLAEFREGSIDRMAARPNVGMRANHGKTDERGLTPQMRKLMGMDGPAISDPTPGSL